MRFLTLLFVVGLAAGFFVFAEAVQQPTPESRTSADGIVVLTGRASRIEDAVELLAAKRGQRLLISGVNPATTTDELMLVSRDIGQLLSRIDLGHEATNTTGNAIETRRWARKNRFVSLIVVTSSWHMPRALIEIEHALPEVRLIPHPVAGDRPHPESWWRHPPTLRLLLVEYAKYLATLARVRLDPRSVGDRGQSTRIAPS